MTNTGYEDAALPAAPQVMDWARRQSVITHYRRDQVVFYRGHLPMGLHIILEGSVTLQAEGSQGPDDATTTVGAGWVLGLHELISGEPYPVSAVAREECRVAFIDKTAFERAIAAEGAPLRGLLRQSPAPGPAPGGSYGRPLTRLCAAIILVGGAAGLILAETSPGGPRERGGQLFEKHQCAACHGALGKGGIKNPNAVGGLVPAIDRVAEGFTREELREKLAKGVPAPKKVDPAGADTPLFMPAWGQVLSEKELDSLIEYLLSLMPKGEGEGW